MKMCLECNTALKSKYSVKFCSKSCSATYNNKKYPKRIANKNIAKCKTCGVEFKYVSSNSRGYFCSRQCCGEYVRRTTSHNKILSGQCNTAQTLKKYLKEIRGNICSICLNEGTHNNKLLSLQLDHIDGDSDNNMPENLRLLCPNCHSQTETFCGRSKKESKRNRYLRAYKGYE